MLRIPIAALLVLSAAPAAARPNLVFILADDLGRETLGTYGGTSYPTPHLDGLAATGLRFDRGYVLPLCAPTRLQVMTGKYSFRNWRAFGVMDPQERTLAHELRGAGYRTGIVGKWQLFSYDPPTMPAWRGQGQPAEMSGFDEFFLWHAGHTEDKGSRYADPTIYDNGTLRRAIAGAYGPDLFVDYAQAFFRRHRDRPFFLYYPMVLTHDPFVPTPDSPDWREPAKRHVETDKDYPDAVVAMKKKAGRTKYFGDMVAYADQLVGRLVAELEALGLRERTLIIFLSDNGTHQAVVSEFRGRRVSGGKGLSLESGVRVPLIANWPGTIAAGRVSDDIIDSVDLHATLLDAAGVRADPATDGRSFLPQLRGERGAPREWAFFHHDPKPGVDKERFALERWAVDKRFKLYEDGRLFDLEADPDQARPRGPADEDAAARAARVTLGRLFERYR
ncbi:MAG: sulfatase-like hydrolase/transferase [Opitutaceae bacterium]